MPPPGGARSWCASAGEARHTEAEQGGKQTATGYEYLESLDRPARHQHGVISLCHNVTCFGSAIRTCLNSAGRRGGFRRRVAG